MESTLKPVSQAPSQDGASSATPDAASQRPAGGETLARAAQGAHDAVDATVAKVAPLVDGVHDKVESARNAVTTGQEWVDAAREAIQSRPFAAVAGALLVGAAYMSLRRR
jgi:ElaB/YqjD/DUF883 family membrane-anchored ribosome-binding protein